MSWLYYIKQSQCLLQIRYTYNTTTHTHVCDKLIQNPQKKVVKIYESRSSEPFKRKAEKSVEIMLMKN